jgi:UDP-N-acetylglucosamine--N-acetylmuramyl-(pentapeptide) pyrophosphoryl-undecaprenol N-acetylglucosamine transferase
MKTLKIMVTGGGTGGHVIPALATIGQIKEIAANKGWQPKFRYVGSKHGIEKRLAQTAGLDFVEIETGKLRRATTLFGYFTIKNIMDIFRVPVGVFQALWQVARFRPAVIFSTGGYVCVPTVIAGWVLRVPVLTHEQTVQIGLANRIATRFARRVGLAYEGAVKELSPAIRSRSFVVGNPVRPVIFDGNKERALQLCGFDPADNDLPTIYVTGGVQGAQIINRAVEATMGELLQTCRIIHQCGQQPAEQEQDHDRLRKVAASLPPELGRRYYVSRFINEEIGDIYALADLLVSRSGAGTVAEVTALGKPALFVPLVPTGGDEQTRNAQRLEDAGAAVIITQSQMNGPRLLLEVRHLLTDRAHLEAMGKAALSLACPNAAHDLAEAVIALAKRQPS